MIQIFHILKDRYHCSRKSIDGRILKQFDQGYDSLISIYEEWKEKSIRDNTFYLLGSPYFKKMIDDHYPPEVIEDFILFRCLTIDQSDIKIPLPLGDQLSSIIQQPTTRLGIHKSYAIQSDSVYDDPVLHNILTEGLVNNGAAMQGIISEKAPYPSQTLSPADDMMMACSHIKNSFRGSKGALLVALPKDVVDVSLDFVRGADPESIYNKQGKIHYIKPEFIIGYVEVKDNQCQFYSKADLLQHYKEKGI